MTPDQRVLLSRYLMDELDAVALEEAELLILGDMHAAAFVGEALILRDRYPTRAH